MQRTLILSALVLSAAPSLAQNTARYRVTFDATWSQATHPSAYPNNAHFSPMIGTTHNGGLDLWETGTLASNAMEVMAETGSPAPLTNLINNAITAGTAGERIQGGVFNSPGMDDDTFFITEDFPMVTLVSMIAPSPDWFVGVDSVSLMENGEWVDKTFMLHAYDSGTDSGANFNSGNQDTNPAEPITLMTGGTPFTGSDPLGVFRFERIPLGTNYCGPANANSTGNSATIGATGSGQAGQPLTLTASDMPTNQFGFFVTSMSVGSFNPPTSSGHLCLGGNIGRFNMPNEVGNTGANGSFFLVVDSNSIPQNPHVGAQPGETWHFQGWFRDGQSNNFTDGLSVTFN